MTVEKKQGENGMDLKQMNADGTATGEKGKLTMCNNLLILTVLVTTIDAQWEGMGDVGSARYEPALLPPCPTIRVLSYSN